MNDMEMNGLDQELGYGSESQNQVPSNVRSFGQEKPKRKMFYEWEVGGQTYRLKLSTSIICKLEEKYRTNLLNVVSQDGIPPLTQMLTIVQGAMAQWNHSMTYKDVQKLFDRYVSEGGNQLSLYSDVVMGTMAVSGFFTESQARDIAEKMQEMETMM